MTVFRYPLARASLFVILGIGCYAYFPIVPVYVLAVMLLLWILVYWIKPYGLGRHFQNLLISLISFGLGLTAASLDDPKNERNHYSHIIKSNSTYYVQLQLRERLKPNKRNSRYYADLLQIDSQNVSGKILVHFPINSKPDAYLGTQFSGFARLKFPEPPKNPGEFNYAAYLEKKQVYAQAFWIDSTTYQSTDTIRNLHFYASTFRARVKKRLEETQMKPEAVTVLMALILGQQQDIAKEVITDYQYAGAVHILSVSGLHTGFILLFLKRLFQWLPQRKYTRYVQLFGILLGLWSFAFIAGLAPPIVRAATMFSIIAFAQLSNRTSTTLYSLLLSLPILLLAAPNLLFDVGFQLSYLALASIIWIQPLLEKRVSCPRFLKPIYSICTVSLAAQLGTMPLTLYYFHQFPGLFLLTNLLIIPAIGLLMGLGMLTVIWASLGPIPIYAYWLTEKGILLMNRAVKEIAQFDQWHWQYLPFSWELMIATFLLLLIGIRTWEKPRLWKRVLFLATCLIWQSLFLDFLRYELQHTEVVLTHKYKDSVVLLKHAETLIIYAHPTDSLRNLGRKNLIDNYRNQHLIRRVVYRDLPNVFMIGQYKVVRLDQKTTVSSLPEKCIVWLSDNPKINLERWINQHIPVQIIADGSNYPQQIKKWRQTCIEKNIPFHDTNEKGYYTFDFKNSLGFAQDTVGTGQPSRRTTRDIAGLTHFFE